MDLARKITIAPLLRWLMCALALVSQLVQAAPTRSPSTDDIFLAARDAAHAGDRARLAKYDAQLQGYLLEP